MEFYGITSTTKNWFKSYLDKHQKKAKTGNHFSEYRTVDCRVGHGSALLFLINGNNIYIQEQEVSFNFSLDDIHSSHKK